MSEARMPTLFEILNRFSKPPVDLWSFYVFLKEQYGGVEYLEFWLDCAHHNALCKEFVKAHMRGRHSQNTSKSSNYPDAFPEAPAKASSRQSRQSNGSPSSSILFDVLREDVLDTNSRGLNDEERDEFDMNGMQQPRYGSVGDEQLKTKRDTVSRLSALLDNMRVPDFTASDSAPNKRYSLLSNHSPPPPQSPPKPHESFNDEQLPKGSIANQHGEKHSASYPGMETVSRTTIRESAQRIVSLYLTPKSEKEIELPSNSQGWSLADDVRQLAAIPDGLDNPKIFDPTMTYVFEALEREALPSFLIKRALSNVQPVSSALRLGIGLLALFGAFWLSFVFVLLDWKPISHRCWIILPFIFGWYLTMSALYHIDPVLAICGFGERDGGGIMRVQEPFVRSMLIKRAIFVIVAIICMTAAFCVLFIFVPGHRL